MHNRYVSVDSADVKQQADLVGTIVPVVAREHGVDTRDLLMRVKMHVPRFSDDEMRKEALITNEIKRLARQISESREGLECLFDLPCLDRLDAYNLKLEEIDESLARTISEKFHYIGSFRQRTKHLGLNLYTELGKKRLMGMISLSPFDLHHCLSELPPEVTADTVLVLSRVFAFAWTPRNTVSYMIGRGFKWIMRNLPHIRMLVTYLNPNVGFTGTTYEATNWVLFGLETNTRYLYLDGNYVTDRFLQETCGSCAISELKRILGNRISVSIQPLLPLRLYAYFLDRRLKKRYGKLTPRVFTKD